MYVYKHTLIHRHVLETAVEIIQFTNTVIIIGPKLAYLNIVFSTLPRCHWRGMVSMGLNRVEKML